MIKFSDVSDVLGFVRPYVLVCLRNLGVRGGSVKAQEIGDGLFCVGFRWPSGDKGEWCGIFSSKVDEVPFLDFACMRVWNRYVSYRDRTRVRLREVEWLPLDRIEVVRDG